jgi:hypothetical protein
VRAAADAQQVADLALELAGVALERLYCQSAADWVMSNGAFRASLRLVAGRGYAEQCVGTVAPATGLTIS